MLQLPPLQAEMSKVALSVPLFSGPMWQPPSVHSPIRQLPPWPHAMLQPMPQLPISHSGPLHSMVQPPPHSEM
jgi:hypothetical protein